MGVALEEQGDVGVDVCEDLFVDVEDEFAVSG